MRGNQKQKVDGMSHLPKRYLQLLKVLLLLSPLMMEADQIINTARTTPVVSNGNENIHVTSSGSITIGPNGGSNYAIRLTGDLQTGKNIVNDGDIVTTIDNSSGNYASSIALRMVISSSGTILNNGLIMSQVGDHHNMAYPVYLRNNAQDGVVINRGTIRSIVGRDGWGVALHIRNNEGTVLNDLGAHLEETGADGSGLYGFATIHNRTGGVLLNRGTIDVSTQGGGGYAVGMYTQYNHPDAEIVNTGIIDVYAVGTGGKTYGFGVNYNYGLIRNRGIVRVENPSNPAANWAFHDDGGNGIVLNDVGAEAYGDIDTPGQHFENRGSLYLSSKSASYSDYFHGYSGSILGIKVDLDNAHHPLYSSLDTEGAIIDGGMRIDVDVQTVLSDQHFLLGQTLYGVIHTDTNLTVTGTVIVTDNSALLNYREQHDATDLDLVPYLAHTLSQAIEHNRCAFGAKGVARILENYSWGSDPDLDDFVNRLYTLSTLDEVAQSLLSALPYATLQGFLLNQEVSRDLMWHAGRHIAPQQRHARQELWIEFIGTRFEQDCSNGYAGYDGHYRGVLLGKDRAIKGKHRLGMALGWGRGDLTTLNSPQEVRFDRFDILFYGRYHLSDSWSLHYETGLGWIHGHESHTLLHTSTVASADYDEWTGYASAELIKEWEIGEDLRLNTGAWMTYTYGSSTGFSEEGAGGMDLRVDDFSHQTLQAGVKIALLYELPRDLSLRLEGSLGYDLINRKLSERGEFRGYAGHSFPIVLDYDSPWMYETKVSIKKRISDGIYLNLDAHYVGEGNSHHAFGVTAGLQWKF